MTCLSTANIVFVILNHILLKFSRSTSSLSCSSFVVTVNGHFIDGLSQKLLCKFHTFIISLTAGRAGKEIRLGHEVKGSLQAAVDARTEGTRSVKTKGTGCSKGATQTSTAGARTYEIKVGAWTYAIKVGARTHEIKVRPSTVGSLALRFTPRVAAKTRWYSKQVKTGLGVLILMTTEQECLSALLRSSWICLYLISCVYLAYFRSYSHFKIVKCIGMY